VQKQADKEIEAEKRRWSWEKGYERGQGIKMSQDNGRCRNGKEKRSFRRHFNIYFAFIKIYR
jgi:hypothetical protein